MNLCLPSTPDAVLLGPAQLPQILALEDGAFRPWSASTVRHWAGHRGTYLVGTEYRGVFVAYVVYTERLHHVRLRRLVVHREHRRGGFGGAAVRALCRGQAECGRTAMALVPDACEEVHYLLRACGWRADAVVKVVGGEAYRFRWIAPNSGGA